MRRRIYIDFPGNRILVTSRPVGYDIARFADRWFRHGVIQDLDDSQIQLFVDNWYSHVLKQVSLSAEEQQELDDFVSTITSDARLRKLAVNPLLLSVMTATHQSKRLPDKRVQLYDDCSDLLLETWAKLKHGGLNWKDLKLSKDDQHKCLAHLGFVLHEQAQESSARNVDNSSGDATATDVPARFMRREIAEFLDNERLFPSRADGNKQAEFLLTSRESRLA